MQIIACQTDIVWEDKAANYEGVRRLLAGVRVSPGALIVLPEMFATGFSMNIAATAEPPGGASEQFLAGLATELGAFVMGGVTVHGSGKRARNEAIVYAPTGVLLARYAKLHPFSFAGEDRYFEPGEGVELFAWHDFTVAPLVCYDLRFPEAFRQATREGAQLLTVIANWPQARESHWLALLRARAIENQAYVVGVNRAGSDPHVRYGGHSLILGPRGETLAEGGDGPQVLVADVEMAPLIDYRQKFPALSDMRADFFPD